MEIYFQPLWVANLCIACVLLFFDGTGWQFGIIISSFEDNLFAACNSRTLAADVIARSSSTVTPASQTSETLKKIFFWNFEKKID